MWVNYFPLNRRYFPQYLCYLFGGVEPPSNQAFPHSPGGMARGVAGSGKLALKRPMGVSSILLSRTPPIGGVDDRLVLWWSGMLTPLPRDCKLLVHWPNVAAMPRQGHMRRLLGAQKRQNWPAYQKFKKKVKTALIFKDWSQSIGSIGSQGISAGAATLDTL